MDYEKYYQTGGTYVLPTEVFNDILDELSRYKEANKKLIEKINFYKTTEWGLRGYEILDLFESILREVE